MDREGRNLYPCVLNTQTGRVYGGEEGVRIQIEGNKVRVVVAEVNLGESVIYPGENYRGAEFIPETKPKIGKK